MQSDSGNTRSLWMATADTPERPPLRTNIRTRVCVVGAGIAGLTTAYLLAREGASVTVIDDGPIGGGETGRTTAHITAALDDRYYQIEKAHGEDGARIAAESHSAAIDRIESIASMEDIDCDFTRLDGFLFLGGDSRADDLRDELEACHRAGLTHVQLVTSVPNMPWNTGSTLRFPRQAQFHPLKYLSGLARAIIRDGGRIFCGTHADRIEDGSPCKVTTSDGHTILADKVVVATNTPVNDWLILHTKQAAYRTFVVAFEVPSGSIPRGLYWDTPDPYHYIRLHDGDTPDREVLIVGGEDHKTGQADDAEARFRCLEEWTRERFHMAGEVLYRWSGQIMEPVDYMGFIGLNPGEDEHIYIATGDSGNGMTHGTIAGMLLTDLIQGRENPWTELYDPARITLRSATQFAKENLNVAGQYADWVTPGEVDRYQEITPGSGAVVRHGMKKVAVYRADDGTVHRMSAVCTHLYCIVDWNSTEKSWDCPCHGSRFDPYGKVINGPAITALQTIESEESERAIEHSTESETGLGPDNGKGRVKRTPELDEQTKNPGS
jgi:glycine/D-amino acid oxidase-like deaminating enzyme/nitrite reductase/ring-hydroxylating ferredoxin subunit